MKEFCQQGEPVLSRAAWDRLKQVFEGVKPNDILSDEVPARDGASWRLIFFSDGEYAQYVLNRTIGDERTSYSFDTVTGEAHVITTTVRSGIDKAMEDISFQCGMGLTWPTHENICDLEDFLLPEGS